MSRGFCPYCRLPREQCDCTWALIADWWNYFVATWKLLPIKTTASLVMFAMGVWVAIDNVLKVFQ